MNYFLTREEQASFLQAGVSRDKHWPALLFRVGMDKVGATAANSVTLRRLRATRDTETIDFPCLVLTGLDYLRLMNEEENEALKATREAELGVDDRKQTDVPITFGH